MFQTDTGPNVEPRALFIFGGFMGRSIRGSAWLVAARYEEGSLPEFLFGIPQASGKSFSYRLIDTKKCDIARSLILSLNLSVLDKIELTILSIHRHIKTQGPLVFWLYQGEGYSRPHIKYMGTGDIILKDKTVLTFTDYEFTWEPKKVKRATASPELIAELMAYKDEEEED